jgi:phage-related baseplate assembly protein
MTTNLDELTRALTVDEIKTAIYDVLAGYGVATTGWKPGAVVRTMIAGVAIVLAALSSLIALVDRSGFLELSEGPWLTLVARYIYDTERSDGSFASGPVLASNSTGAVYSLDPGDLILSNSTTGATYRNTAAVVIGSMASNVEVAVVADQLGSYGTAQVGEIDALVTPLLGVTVTNAAAIVGTDEQSDTSLRSAAQERAGALSPDGPADAYRYFARTAVRADGTAIGVTRIKETPNGTGGVDVLVATATGGVTGTQGNPATDLGAVFANVEANAVPLGVTLTVASADALAVNIVAAVWVREGLSLSNTQIEDRVQDAITLLLSEIPIGGDVISPAVGKVYREGIQGCIADTIGSAWLITQTLTTPAADVEPDDDEAPVIGTFALTINRVAA